MNAKQYLASLSAWDGVGRLEGTIAQHFDKEHLLAAEVRLPVPLGTDVSTLRTVLVRPPYQRESRLLLVDVSRLPAL
jgi:hypothetical protein